MSENQTGRKKEYEERVWRDQGNLVSILLASLPNDTVITLGHREYGALSDLLFKLTKEPEAA